ncbi:MAG: DUF4145 domain-containing protein [Rhodobacter sp.]|nr:DUF4145 domain-containing protein [Rhodobacter sp.]
MTSDDIEFAHAISHESGLNEVDLARRTCWYLCQRDGVKSVPIKQIVDFLAEHSVRPNINLYRLRDRLKADRGTSISSGGAVQLPKKSQSEIADRYSDILSAPPVISDTVLVISEFEGSRKYVASIVKQVNGSYQFEFYDCCAVMMRRLVEVLIIDSYSAKGEEAQIRGADGNIVMLNGLINALKSGRTFRLSRNAPSYLETLKVLGDTAAHSRNYITKKKDIDDFAQKYRMLVEEVRHLS